jgi:hypothetical protein
MGRPKHLLTHPVTGVPLYKHHLATLKQLKDEQCMFPDGIWVSCRRDQREELELSEVRLMWVRASAGPGN